MSVPDCSLSSVDLHSAAQRVAHEATSLNAALRLLDESYHLAGVEFSLIIDAALLHARRLTNFLLCEPREGHLGAHLFFDGGAGWRYQLAACPYLASRRSHLDKAVALLAREPVKLDSHEWNFAALSNELADQWDSFVANLAPDRLELFLARGSAQPVRLYRVRGKLFYAGSPPRLTRR